METEMPPNTLIAIVDDDTDFLAALTSLVRSLGCKVESFSSVEAFFDRARAADFSCVISDINMPNMDGLELAQTVRKSQQDLPIMLMTGCAGPYLERRAYDCGATAFVCKPFGFKDLMAGFRQLGLM